MTRLILLAALVALSSVFRQEVKAEGSQGDSDGLQKKLPELFDYGQFVGRFQKSYSPLETINKAKIFFGRTLRIVRHNLLFTQQKTDYFLAQNEFTDMTPNELKEMYHYVDPELKQVKEASSSPDQPADTLPSVKRYMEEEAGYSSCSLEQLKEKREESPIVEVAKSKPIVNFMEDQSVPDVRGVLKKLLQMPDIAEQMSQLANIKAESPSDPAYIERAMKRNKVERKLVVESNNKDYEPQMVSSSASNQRSEAGKNYAAYLLDEFPVEFNIMEYPTPDIPVSEDRLPLRDAFKRFGVFVFGAGYEPKKEVRTASNSESTPKLDHKIVYKVDWRKSGCISEPLKQNTCNSCYAFATLALMEFFYCRQSNKMVHFSPQYIVDCGTNSGLNGCQGGKISNVGRFIAKFGLELNSMYPYVGQENQCPFEADSPNVQQKAGYLKPSITHWQNFQDMASWHKWIKKSPIIVGINLPTDFMAYGGGIHDGLDCAPDITHAMLLVGVGKQDGKDFWLLKNSYSNEWGEDGYFRLAFSAPVRCFNSAIVARASFSL